MLLPQEIRNHEFTRAIRGYTTTEVDEYIDFLAEKFDSLNRENDELERKLTIAIFFASTMADKAFQALLIL